jgi:two-component system, OmpR family, response regulator
MSTHRDILLVEDEAAIADALRRLLVRAGYTVRLATDGRQALAALGAERPAVLILDLVLPRVSGFTVLEHMRQHQMTLPVLVITANPLYLASVPHAGILHVLLKPFGLEELLAALRTIINLPDPV